MQKKINLYYENKDSSKKIRKEFAERNAFLDNLKNANNSKNSIKYEPKSNQIASTDILNKVIEVNYGFDEHNDSVV